MGKENKMTEQELMAMELHEKVLLEDYMNVHRVIGGWIYDIYSPSGEGWVMSTTFVPEPPKQSGWKKYTD